MEHKEKQVFVTKTERSNVNDRQNFRLFQLTLSKQTFICNYINKMHLKLSPFNDVRSC